MKRRKIVLWSVLLLFAVGALAVIIFIQALKPTYDGTKELDHIQKEVQVHFDTYGIPHIYAENERDAMRSLGYVHAQDRLWQMELLRRVGSGRLSEVFGPDMLGTDKFFLSLGIDEASRKTVSSLAANGEAKELSEAYLDGINQFIAEGPTPVEFILTGLEKKPFALTDIYNTIGYMAFSFAMAHKTDPLLTNIRNKLGPAYLEDFEIRPDSTTIWIPTYPRSLSDSIQNGVVVQLERALKGLPLPQFIGSNSWVLGPKKTKNGQVIFANDPHIGFSQPSVWYEAHIVTPDYEKYGYHMAGIPFPLLGHDRALAYGLTMFENDDIDFYYESTNPQDSTQYATKEGWKTYSVITRSINVKDGDPVEFRYRTTEHGPVLNGVLDELEGSRDIAMSWIYTKTQNKVLDAVYGMSHASTMEEFSTSLKDIHAPGLNVMYGDAQGNIAWWASAKLYEMPKGVDTKFILNGANGEEEPLRYMDFRENPRSINPPWNYVYSANNQPDSIAGNLYRGYYLPQNRAKRIVDLLQAKYKWDREDVATMITDVTSSVNPSIVLNLAKNMDVAQMSADRVGELDRLNAWDGSYPLDGVEGTIFHRWVYFFLKNTFGDELGDTQFDQLLSTHILKRMIAPMVTKENSIWWDDITTTGKAETKSEIIMKSFDQAIGSLEKEFGTDPEEWTWDKVHTVEHEHPIGKVALLRSFFNIGPFPVVGSREVINNMGFSYDESLHYTVSSGPSTRRIVDFSDVENSISILPTGQSGNPFSPYYEDQAQMFVRGEFRKMMMNKEEILRNSHNLLTFSPSHRP